jgi:hypothetical protein
MPPDSAAARLRRPENRFGSLAARQSAQKLAPEQSQVHGSLPESIYFRWASCSSSLASARPM